MKIIIQLLVFSILVGCAEKKQVKVPSKEEMMEINRLSAKKEAIQIQQFADGNKWPTTVTGTGLHIYIYESGSGEMAKTDQNVTVKMTVTLLNGDTCYSWKEYGEESFVIDHNHNESGLHEALKMMRIGDKAKVILPSHLAFGVAGDFEKIPPRTSVVYDIELVTAR